MSFITAMILVFAPIKRLAEINVVLQRGLAASDSIFTLLDSQAEDNNKGEKDFLDKEFNAIKFINIKFSYTGTDSFALENINFEVPRGTTCAIVGRSGSGKSTLMNLLPRFYDIREGKIEIDDKDISKATLVDLREMIAYVGQDLTLFNDTVRNNIAYGLLENMTENQIIDASKTAHAYDFIMSFDKGFDTLVGDNGILLSGGQRQRIAIARAILKDSPILLLDEATSSLDSESEKLIQQALEDLRKNKTTIVIAHRLSTIEKADNIIVLDEGKIVEQGNHEALIESNGLYSSLHKIQFPVSNQ